MKNLVVILGPTGIGKTELSIEIAKILDTEIISADSRQIYGELSIGTAAPNFQQLHTVKHHLVQEISIHNYFNVSHFEQMAIKRLNNIFEKHDNAVMAGGSMMYIDVVCKGIDDIPDIDIDTRNQIWERYEKEGLEPLRFELKKIDPDYYEIADLKNPKRIIHALEIYYMTGKPYTSFLTRQKRTRDFNIIKIGLNTDRTILYNNINRRVDKMVEAGLIDEAKGLYPYRHLNSLNTVGYRELFNHFDGSITLDEAIEQIKANSRKYARKQLSWFRRDKEIHWFEPSQKDDIINLLKENNLLDNIYQ